MANEKDALQKEIEKKQRWNIYLTIGTILAILPLTPILLMMVFAALDVYSFGVFDTNSINNQIEDTFLEAPYMRMDAEGIISDYPKPFYMGKYLPPLWLWAFSFYVVGYYKIRRLKNV